MSDEPDARRRRTLLSLALPSLLLPMLGAGVTAVPAGARGDSRTLVAFLSRSGNTRVIAGQLQRRFDADIFEVRTREPYPADYEETVARAQRERDALATPALAERVPEVGRYETVFLGFPIWGMALPAPVRTFLVTHDLAGRTLVPFITHGGYGVGSAPDSLAELAPGARIVTPFVLEADQERATMNAVTAWFRTVEPEL